MVRSLLIKLAMLAVTLGALMWIGSATHTRQVTTYQVQPAAAVPVSTASPHLTSTSPTMNRPADVTNALPDSSDISVSRQSEEREPPASIDGLTGAAHTANPDPSRQIDLNQATASDLEALPGIGPKLAQRVIEHRTVLGHFTKVEDLRQVKGIGRKKFDRLRSHVLVTNTRSISRHKGTQ